MGIRASCLPTSVGDTGPHRPANMQMVHSRGADVPKGAVILDDQEVIRMMHNEVLNWTPKSEMWPVLYGTGGLAGGAAASGLYSNHMFRQAFKLGHRGRIMSYAATVVIPTMLSAVVNQAFVVSPLLIGHENCPVCTELRSISFQFSLGFAQPLVLGGLACSALSRTYKTYPMPSLTKNLPKVIEVYGNILKKKAPGLLFLLGINVIGAAVITRYQGLTALKVHQHIRETQSNNTAS